MKAVRSHVISKNGPKQPTFTKPSIFSQQLETELVNYVLQLQKILFRLTLNDVRSLAEQLLKKNKTNYKCRTNASSAGHQWVLGFMKRHPEVILRIPPKNSNSADFETAELEIFYKFLSQLYEHHQISSDRIYNTDDIEISVQNVDESIVRIGKKATVYRSVGEKDKIATKICINAENGYIPNMTILPSNHLQDDLKTNASHGTWSVYSDNGCITTELFIQWLKRFINISGATKERPVLLLFDRHAIYMKNVDVIKMTRDNGVIIVSFPPHTRKLLQPLNKEFMDTLKKYYDETVKSWLQSNPGHRISVEEIPALFDKAFYRITTNTLAKEGFRKCGIFPLDCTIFKDSDFLPPIPKQVRVYQEQTPPLAPIKILQQTTKTNNNYLDLYNNPRPGCSFWPDYMF
ncbi:uncharacterized protein [Battus philenor]|uniref:uncharacterized protein n=1 Tax=Battus philenor TaxID=42288 RepID=UPI0035D02854